MLSTLLFVECNVFIFQPKSLHACVPPKPPKPAVAAPSSDMLKAIREGQPTAKIAQKPPPVNPSLSVKKRTGSETDYGKAHYPVRGIDYMTRRQESHSRSSSLSSEDRASEPAVSPTAIKQFEQLHHEMTYTEPGAGSMRDKVIEYKRALREAQEIEKTAKEAKTQANHRYRNSYMTSKELRTIILEKEERLQKVESKLQIARGKLYERQRLVEESLGDKRRAENLTLQTIKEKETMHHEIIEAKNAREMSVKKLREVSRKLTIKQTAVQNAQDHEQALKARAKTLNDMKEMYRLRINSIHNKRANLSMKNEQSVQRIYLLQQSLSAYSERIKQAEKMLLPLKMYANQLEDAIRKTRSNKNRVSYDLATYQQRLRGAQMYSDL